MMSRILTFLTLSSLALSAQIIERKIVPLPVKVEATEAVRQLAFEVRKGNFLYSLDKMYPRWKEGMAKRVGGEEALRKRLESVPREMLDKGISIIDFQVGEPVSAFEVKGNLLEDSKIAPIFSEYLVFVPTTTLYRVIDGGAVKRLETKGYQVAIASQKIDRTWWFIDGSNLTIRELRSLFPNLPQSESTLNLPERGMRQIGN